MRRLMCSLEAVVKAGCMFPSLKVDYDYRLRRRRNSSFLPALRLVDDLVLVPPSLFIESSYICPISSSPGPDKVGAYC